MRTRIFYKCGKWRIYKWGCHVIYLDEGGFFMKTLTQIVGMEKKYKEGILVKEKTTSA